MRWDVIGLVIGWTLRIFSFPLIFVGFYSWWIGEGIDFIIRTYAITFIIALIASQNLIRYGNNSRSNNQALRDREAFAAVALAWPPIVLLGAIPFWLGGMFFGPFEFYTEEANFTQLLQGSLHSWFESMSGFTTTGATVIDFSTSPNCTIDVTDCIASQSQSLLLWRSLTQWLGGMGVIMLGLLILSRVLGGGMSLAKAELTGPTLSRLGPTLQSTARRLWLIYTLLTIIEMGALYFIGGMGAFDAVNYSLTTLPSGGFGTSDSGIMGFESAIIESILIVFMLLTCINFSILNLIILGRSSEALKDEELKSYLLILSVAWLAMAFNIYRSGPENLDLLESIRHTLFQTVSISSTGYSSTNFANWPVFSQFVLLLLMIIGASAGSTGGGLKVLRIRILFELAKREVVRIIQPRKVIAIRFNEEVIEERTVWMVLGMISSWAVIVTASMLTFSLFEPSLEMKDVLSVSISLLGNTGPALGAFGPTATWASLSEPSMFIATLLMWLGRLELLTVLVLLHPRTWSRLE
tara:strand:- start:159300 stop:160871 length:1572 start_codon:yes stop_codon:yes gene_type:complete